MGDSFHPASGVPLALVFQLFSGVLEWHSDSFLVLGFQPVPASNDEGDDGSRKVPAHETLVSVVVGYDHPGLARVL